MIKLKYFLVSISVSVLELQHSHGSIYSEPVIPDNI
jgi:hypothetical protein